MPDTSKAAYERWLKGVRPPFFLSYFEWVQRTVDTQREASEECCDELNDA